ncbi:MAG: nitrogenase component 1, partial [Porcincola intestinalis]
MPDVRQETGGCKTEDLFQKGTGAGCGAVHKPGGCTVEELNRLGPEGIPEEYVTSSHLVYNSPATLAYNSPGAEGFGVKRAGLAVPGSIMLIVSPGCCGRNTAEITKIKGYEERFFYLEIGETDLVTGRHLKVIPQAVAEIVESCRVQPSLVMICITCVDALLGTDMERVARKAETLVQIPVRPCYMYALTREGRRPPMVAVRQSLYSLLPSQKRIRSSVNLLGFFAPVDPDCELFGMLRGIGVKTIRQISTCENIGEFYRMGEANFNLVLNPEAQDAADDLSRRLGIPSVALTRFYGADRIARQYRALSAALGVKWSCGEGRQEAEEA